jgi:hypothetical protein
MTHSEFEQRLQDFYEARLSNDADRCMQCFAAHPIFRLAGSVNASSIARQRFAVSDTRSSDGARSRVDLEGYGNTIE